MVAPDLARVVKLVESLGADEAEAYLIRSRVVEARFSERVESITTRTTLSLGITAVKSKAVAVVGTQDLSDAGIKAAAEAVVRAAAASRPDPHWPGFPAAVGAPDLPGAFDRFTAEAGAHDVSSAVEEAVRGVKEGHEGAAPTRGMLRAEAREVWVANSYSGPASRGETSAWVWVMARAGKGTYGEFDVSRSLRSLDAYGAGRGAGSRAADFADASLIKTGKYDVILAPDVAAEIVSVMLSPAVSAREVQAGRSPLVGKVGHRVTAEIVTVTDAGREPELVGSRAFDDEGVATHTRPIIKRGYLTGYVYDTYTAAKDGVESTGNAWRSYSSRPAPSPNHLRLEPGGVGYEEMVAEVKEGLLVMATIGAWLSNPTSGLLNATITHAYLIRGGEVAGTLKGGVLGGNFYELMKEKVVALSREWRQGMRASAPYVLLKDVTVAGK